MVRGMSRPIIMTDIWPCILKNPWTTCPAQADKLHLTTGYAFDLLYTSGKTPFAVQLQLNCVLL